MSQPRLCPLARLFLAALLLAGCGGATSVEVAEVERGPLAVRVTTNGKVEPIDEAEIRARLAGRILEIPDAGVFVEAGAVVLRIDEGPAAAALAAVESERLASLEALRSAQDHLLRVRRRATTDRELFEQEAITKALFDESQASLEEARARVEHLESEVPLQVASLDLRIRELRDQLDSATVRAPFAGTLYRKEGKRGEFVEAGQPLLWLADLERLRVRANVDQVDMGRVRSGQKVAVTSTAYPGRSWHGQVSEVIPHVFLKESRAVSESLALLHPPIEGLVPGMNVDVEILVEEVADALQIPAASIFTEGGQNFVYRVEDDRARVTPVRLGNADAARIEILEGLEAKDRVVVGPVNGLRDGDRIRARRRDGSQA
jgi:HlyD family secretion protein